MTSSATSQFSDLELDLLSEILNVGVGNAANSLSKMVRQEVLLSVPSVDFLETSHIEDNLGKYGTICSVSQHMDGPFSAESMLLFPEERSLEIVSLLLGEELPEEMLVEMQPEAFSEIGNIVINACIGSISQMLNTTFHVDLPQFQLGTLQELLHSPQVNPAGVIMLVKIDMTLKQNDLIGYLAFLLGTNSMEQLQGELKRIIGNI